MKQDESGDRSTGPGPGIELSVVIPVHNEEHNLALLLRRLDSVLDRLGLASEILVVDDGSTDGTSSELERLRGELRRLTTIRLRRRFQKSAAYMAGFHQARGRIIVTMDGDGQDDPADLPRLLAALGAGADLVSGWKVSGKGAWTRRVPSRIFNRVTAAITRIRLHDFNCPFKAYRREVITDLRLYGELHRFIPVLAHGRGYQIAEVQVANLPRGHGRSKYGSGRFLRGFFDLLTVLFLTRYTRKPLHFFGIFGIIFSLAGFGFASYLVLLKILAGTPFTASLPLLLFSILLMVLGFQTFSLGFLSDLLIERREDDSPYSIHSITGAAGPDGREGRSPGDRTREQAMTAQGSLQERLRGLVAIDPSPEAAPLGPSKYRSRNPARQWLVGRYLAHVAALLHRMQPEMILEAGCGEGYVLTQIGPAANRATIGTDRDVQALRHARDHFPSAWLVCCDVAALPFRNGSIDAVCCFEVLEHLERPETAVQELGRVCSNQLLLSVPLEPFFRISNLLAGTHFRRWGSDPGHVQIWSRGQFARFLSTQVRVQTHTIQYPWQIVVGRRKDGSDEHRAI